MMATNVATGLEIEGEDHIRPVTWEEWITLPIREQDEAVHTVRGQIRVPTVIVAVNYAKVPKKRPSCAPRHPRARRQPLSVHRRVLRPVRAAWTHVLPRSRGGKDAWENLVWSAKEVNQREGRPSGLMRHASFHASCRGNCGLGLHSQLARIADWKPIREEMNWRRVVQTRPPSLNNVHGAKIRARPATISSNTRARRICSARRGPMTINTWAKRNPRRLS